jgi:L-threonylcarbamoyladenylate synthase
MKTEIGVDIDLAIKFLSENELVAIPTETVYGLSANAFVDIAVEKIFFVKNRPFFNPLILHTDSIEKIRSFTDSFPKELEDLVNNIWPGPLTILLKKNKKISDLVTANSPFLAVRIPKHNIILDLLSKIDFPLVAPSANPFGYVSPTRASHVLDQLSGKVKYILDGGICEIGLESTIISFDKDQKKILIHRIGGLSEEDISKYTDLKVFFEEKEKEVLPGSFDSHYSPSKKLIICSDLKKEVELFDKKKVGVISFMNNFSEKEYFIKNLSEKGDLKEAAKNLYKLFREFDKSDVDMILIEKVPPSGIGKAINDKIKKASFKL